MQHDFSGRTAFITGGASGIGRSTALAFAHAKAKVAVVDSNLEAAAKVVLEIQELGGSAIALATDVADAPGVHAAVEATVRAFGRLDFAFNNAGIRMSRTDVQLLPLAEWQRVIEVNVTGIFICIQAQLAVMLPRGRGAIVNTASINGFVCTPGSAHYTASKHAIVGLTKAAALDVAAKGVRINGVGPGVIETPMLAELMGGMDKANAHYGPAHAAGRLGKPEEVAAAVLWLCSDDASFVVGHTLMVDGGYLLR